MTHIALHVVARSTPGTLLFHTWREARALWDRLIADTPGLKSLVLMPDHLHLICDAYDRARIGRAFGSYARWRNHRRGASGPVFAPHPLPTTVADRLHLRRTIRYLHLNPVRKCLVECPLEWVFSTHRDMVGLTLDPVVRRVSDAPTFHAAVVTDRELPGPLTELPYGVVGAWPGATELMGVAAGLWRRGPIEGVRDLPLRRRMGAVLRGTCGPSDSAIAVALGCDRSTIHRARPDRDGARLLLRVAGDHRFAPLPEFDLRSLPSWREYRHRR